MQQDKRLVFDVETQKELAEVGGFRNVHLLGISVVGVYTYADDTYKAYEEKDLPELEKVMADTSLIIGFNTKHFDNQVIQPYFKNFTIADAPTLDLMEKLEAVLGYRPGLGALASATLGEQKSGHGLEALQWYKEGKIDQIKKYCLQDVKLTKEVYEYGLNHGSVLFESRVSGLQTVAASWFNDKEKKDIQAILADAYKNKKLVEIDYVSMKSEDGEEARKKRNIEIYSINKDTIEAYCHTRKDKRYFKIHRILDARVIDEEHKIPSLF